MQNTVFYVFVTELKILEISIATFTQDLAKIQNVYLNLVCEFVHYLYIISGNYSALQPVKLYRIKAQLKPNEET